MKKLIVFISVLVFITSPVIGQQSKLKVFISVDMEGITGVVNSRQDASRSGKDYDYFRMVMTKEANAAIEGALAAGATDILVRDSHGSALNLLPEELNRNARLLRDWSGGPKSMMEGIDETFDAVIFIGYHAKAGTPDALMEHTMSGNIIDVSINGVSLPEAGINALIAGYYNVPVVFASGDKALTDQVLELLGDIEVVPVKEAIGNAGLNLHPDVARERIKAGVIMGLSKLGSYKPYKLSAPFTLNIKVKNEKEQLYPGAKKTGEGTFTFTSNDIMEIIKAFEQLY